jgi:hypothetical protein
VNSWRDDYKQAQGDYFWTLPRALGALFVTIVAIFLLMVALTPLTIGFGWISGEAKLRSFEHVRDTYREAYDDVNSMEANARQACRAQQRVDDAKKTGNVNVVSQRESQLAAVENNYDRVKGEYDAYMTDHFRGGVIRPGDLPMPYPTLAERLKEVCAAQ